MKDGYIRVASASIDTLIGNVKHNANEIKKILKETREKKAQVVVFPELVLSGYTLEDLFLQNRLLNECLIQLEEIMLNGIDEKEVKQFRNTISKMTLNLVKESKNG